jgi:hypothetical protein
MVVAVAAKAHWKNQSLHLPVDPELVVRFDQSAMAKPVDPLKGVPLVMSPYARPHLHAGNSSSIVSVGSTGQSTARPARIAYASCRSCAWCTAAACAGCQSCRVHVRCSVQVQQQAGKRTSSTTGTQACMAGRYCTPKQQQQRQHLPNQVPCDGRHCCVQDCLQQDVHRVLGADGASAQLQDNTAHSKATPSRQHAMQQARDARDEHRQQ